MKKLIPALALLLISAVLLGTSSFAWFSMNTTVTVTGMQVTTTVSSNLQIANDAGGVASTARINDAAFTTSVDTEMGSAALLEPVSTIDGVNFFYTVNARSTGDAVSDVYAAYNPANTSAFNTAYVTSGAVGYFDYVFQLKAVNTVGSAKAIKITKLNLLYSQAFDANKAFRVALFVEDLGETGVAPAGGVGALKGIYSQTGAANFSDGGGVNKAVNDTDAAPVQLVTNDHVYNSVDNIASVPANKTNYYKVVVRLYIEGEDTTCNNTTFATLTGNNWALDLEIKIDDAATTNTAVSSLTKCTYGSTSEMYYDGSAYLWAAANRANIGTETNRLAISEQTDAIKNEFGYVWNVTSTVTNASVVSSSTVAKSNAADAVVATYAADDGHVLPAAITVTIGGEAAVADTDYVWNQAAGTVTIKATKAVGDIAISFTAPEE